MKSLALIFLILLLTAFCSSEQRQEAVESTPAAPQAAAQGWRIVDPGGAGAMFIPTVNPRDPDHVFVRCDMTGSYVTENGGRSWRMFNLRTMVYDFEFDPSDPGTVYASNTGLYRSEDRGRRWRLIYPDPKNIIAERMVGDHAEQSFETVDGMPAGPIEKIRVDPEDSRQIYLGLRDKGRVTVMASKDRGASWHVLARVPGQRVLAIFPGSWDKDPGLITVFTEQAGVKISSKTGAVSRLTLPVERIRTAEGGRGPEGNILYILADVQVPERGKVSGGVYRSEDCGRRWVQVNKGLLGDDPPRTAKEAKFITLAVCEGRPQVVYLSCDTYMADMQGSLVRHFGTLKSETAGRDWRWVYRADNDSIFTNNYTGYWKDWSYGPGWSESPWSIGVSPTDPDVCYYTDSRTVRSTDGGASWEQVCSDIYPDSSCGTRGIGGNTTYGVHFDPFDESHIFITYTDVGLFHSYNRGKSWFHAIKGIPLRWRNTCYWLVFDPEHEGRLWSAWAYAHDLPRPKMLRGRMELPQYQGGVAVSDNGGSSWLTSNKGLPVKAHCTHILLDSTSPADSRTLYVCAFGTGVFKSTDGARTWQKADNGLGQNRNAWRLVRTPEGVLYLLVARGLKEGKMVDGAIYRSGDGASSWKPLPLPEGVNAPNDLVYDPGDPKRMYLSCWPWPMDGREHCGGLLRTEDGGMTWKRVFNEEYHVYAAAVDPVNPNTVYINTFDSAAFRSDDRGESWRRLEGYNFKWGHRPVPDPHHPGMLYLTAFGGNAYHGPSGGVPGAFEDIENLPARSW